MQYSERSIEEFK